MTGLQKLFLSAAAVISFGFYAIVGKSYDASRATPPIAVDATQATNTGGLSNADFQTYVDQINTAAQQQKATPPATPPPPPIQVRGGDNAGESEVSDNGSRVSQQTTAQQAAQLAAQQAQAQVDAQAQAQAAAQANAQAQADAQAQAAAQAAANAAAKAAQNQGQYRDGSYTGQSVNVYYGYVQVKAIVQGGRLTDVQFLQYPNDRRTSQYINSQAMPYLTQEAVQAQSANVNGVSGASATSQGFVESLGGALSQAKV